MCCGWGYGHGWYANGVRVEFRLQVIGMVRVRVTTRLAVRVVIMAL